MEAIVDRISQKATLELPVIFQKAWKQAETIGVNRRSRPEIRKNH